MESRVRQLEIESATMKNDIEYIKKSVEYIPDIFNKLGNIEISLSENDGEKKASWKITTLFFTVCVGLSGGAVSLFLYLLK